MLGPLFTTRKKAQLTCLYNFLHLIRSQDNEWVIHGKNNRCLELNPKTEQLHVNTCDKNNKNMRWAFGVLNETALHDFDTIGVQ